MRQVCKIIRQHSQPSGVVMKESVYGPQFEKLVKSSGDMGICAGDLYQIVGSSRQAVYGWIKSNMRNLCEVGTSPTGGVQYRWRTEAQPSASRERGTIEVGMQLTVTRLRVVSGRVLATLTCVDVEIEIELPR